MKAQLAHNFDEVVSVENLLSAWQEFVRGKRSKPDVNRFSLHLMDHIMALHEDLAGFRYKHGAYHAFKIADPKPRDIHKAVVRDRLLHHALYRKLYPFFDSVFIADSFSCRKDKGTHKAMQQFECFHRKVSRNNKKTCWVLKCDIRKFFASIDHAVLLTVLSKYISDERTLWIIKQVVGSFASIRPSVGLPLGNLTSQLLVNVYMNEFDKFMKHQIKAQYYIRYADDFVVLSRDRVWLELMASKIQQFLFSSLKLQLHPNKVELRTVASGVDFLGWVHFPDHRVMRTATKSRMMKRLVHEVSDPVITSYLGLIQHGNTKKTKRVLIETGLTFVLN